MTVAAELLRRYRPLLRYDSQESYFADSAAIWTDSPGNVLRRADGEVIAAARPKANQAQLSLSLLAAKQYSRGAPVRASDVISDPTRDYSTQAAAIHQRREYANRMYGHTETGSDGRLWLQYWFFYFYNDYNLLGPLVRAGLHEGDWETIQMRLNADNSEPDLAVFAQHSHAQAKPWGEVERVDGRPVVYPARGSHASYFSAGVHWTGVWFDYADGERATPELTLEIVTGGDPEYRWIYWPGHWGDTKSSGGLDATSPTGPAAHGQWRDPHALLEKAKDHATHELAPAPQPPATPEISVSRRDNALVIRYRVADAPGQAPLAQLTATVNSAQDPTPPSTYRQKIESIAGTIEFPLALRPDRAYDINVSVASTDGVSSSSARADLPAAGAQSSRRASDRPS